jgi:hypothetical protein
LQLGLSRQRQSGVHVHGSLHLNGKVFFKAMISIAVQLHTYAMLDFQHGNHK